MKYQFKPYDSLYPWDPRLEELVERVKTELAKYDDTQIDIDILNSVNKTFGFSIIQYPEGVTAVFWDKDYCRIDLNEFQDGHEVQVVKGLKRDEFRIKHAFNAINSTVQ